MMCVSSVQYAVLVNGEPCGKIIPSRGLRQGDLISPYLFLLCAEALSAIISRANFDGELTGVPTSKRGPRLSHLFFADDSLLFCRTTIAQWVKLLHILLLYEEALGQQMNSNKTSILFNRNSTNTDKENIMALAGILASQSYETYLGLLALVGRSRVAAFKHIIDRVWKRLKDWKLKFLSQTGIEILLKVVVQAIPTYCMGVFLLPKSLCTEINSLMQNFWWGQQGNDRKIHWISWSKMGIPKSRGGMGFWDLACFNKALLAKQIWRMWKNPMSLVARIMKAKYHPNCSIIEAARGRNPFFAWRSIQSSSDLIQEGLIWRVGNGEKIRIWQDKWLPMPSTFKVYSTPILLHPTATVKELIDSTSKDWNRELIDNLFSVEEARVIHSLPISRTDQADVQIWRRTPKGNFTARSAYYMQKEREIESWVESSSRGDHQGIWKAVSKLGNLGTEKNFFWRACHDILPT